ncbi:MAG: type IV secretory system conjugative DNA transfer family protein [Candidatus Saccharimonadales bacterium]
MNPDIDANTTTIDQAEPANQGVVLLLQVPRTNDKKELAAEQMFASLHGLLTLPSVGLFKPPRRERISFEIAVLKKRIGFYVWVPEYLKSFVEEQIYAQYPTVHISEIPDFTMSREQTFATTLSTELKMSANSALPIKTFQSFEVDPLAAITATLAKFEDDEEAWIQLMIKPAAGNWHKKSERYINGLKGGSNSAAGVGILQAFWSAPDDKKPAAAKMADYEQTRASAAEEKSQKLAFEAAVRIVYRGNLPEQQAKLRMQSIIASYRQFNTTYLNGFATKRVAVDPYVEALYRARQFGKVGFICNIEEVATLYHLPHTNVETPYILWAVAQTAEPPANLPLVTSQHRDDISPVASTNFRGHNTMFGLPRVDRGRHLYIIGQTGVGKSGLLELLTISDVYSPFGFAVIDPHGDYAQNVLKRIPAERAQDVIYFNPADTDFPVAFNPMEVPDPKLKSHTTSELIGVLKRMFDSWGPRLEYILRYCLLALLDYPECTMLDITRILTDKTFRKDVLKYVDDPVVRNFWTVEFASWNDRFAAEAIAPVLNKVGAFTANPLVRNIIGQPKSSFNIRQIMNEHKILIVNLSRGLVGEDNASLLGALLVTKIQLAAMSRADIPAEQRSPFYLYVDEFQNFATDSFATILSEARKYGLNLTVANQYTAQMPIEVRDAVFGNVGSIIAFRMSADDANKMLRYFQPKFEESDLVHMHNRYFLISMTIDGEKVQGFSAISLNLPESAEDHSAAIIAHSREQYAITKQRVEYYVGERYHNDQSKKPAPTKSDTPPPVSPKPQTNAGLNLPEFSPPKSSQSNPAQTVAKLAKTVVGNVIGTSSPAAKPKRKRSRRRKKPIQQVQGKPASETSNSPAAPQPAIKNPSSSEKPANEMQELSIDRTIKLK